MSRDHDPAHVALLIDALAAPGGDEPQALRAQLARCAHCSDEWRSLREMQRLSSVVARERALDEAAIDASAPAPGEQRIAQTLEALARRQHPAQRARRTQARARWLAAAAVVFTLAGGAAWRAWSEPVRERRDIPLGRAIEILEPTRTKPYAGRFVFRAERADGWFQVEVRELGEHGAVIARSPRLDQPSWEVGSELAASIPSRFEWEARVYDGSGELVGVAVERIEP